MLAVESKGALEKDGDQACNSKRSLSQQNSGESAMSLGYTYSLGFLRPDLLLTTHCDPQVNHKTGLMSYNQPLKKKQKTG